MNTIKKFIAIALSLAFVLGTSFHECFALEQKCKVKNEYGQFLNEYCGELEAKERLKNGESYIKMDKLGFNGDRGLYLFDFNRLKDVVSILEDDLQKSLTKEIGKKDNAKIAAAAMLAGTLAAGAAGAVSHLYNKKQESNKQLIETIKKAITQNPFQPIDSSSFKKYKRLQQNPPALLSRSHIVAGIVSATVLAGAIVGLFSSYHFASLSANKSENKWNNIFNLISAVKKINAYLEHNCWQDRDAILIDMQNIPQKSSASVGFLQTNKNYTEAEKVQHKEDIKVLKKNIDEFLAKYN